MATPSRSEILKSNPIEDRLNGFRDFLNSTYEDLDSEDNVPQPLVGILPNAIFRLLDIYLPLRRARASVKTCQDLYNVNANDFNIRRIISLLQAAHIKKSDYNIWNKVYAVVAEYTPPRPSTTSLYFHPTFLSCVTDTPSRFTTGRLQNTSEPVKQVGRVLRYELNSNLELDHTEFDVIYLAIPQAVDAATAVFKKCCKGEDLLYTADDGWRSWEKRYEKDVQQLLEEYVSKFMKFLDEAGIESPSQQRFMLLLNTPIPESGKWKPDLFVATFAGESTGVSNKRIASWR